MAQQEYPMYVDDRPKRSGCFLLTPIGCLITACIGAVGCVCVFPFLSLAGFGAVAAIFLTNTAVESDTLTASLESADVAATRLEINDPNATINIIAGARNEIVVDYELTVYSYTTGAAESALQDYSVSLNPGTDNTFTLTVDKSSSGIHFYDITYNIQVPDEIKDIILTADDEVRIDGVTANMVITSEANNITLTNVAGRFDLTTTSGDITWSGQVLDSSTMTTNSGAIQVTFTGTPNVSYTATSASGSVICPLGGQRLTCTEHLGDRTIQLAVNSDSGNITVLTSGQ